MVCNKKTLSNGMTTSFPSPRYFPLGKRSSDLVSNNS
nr:MAG TPA: hypothetical protein [Caudoviricetes sp.]